MRTQGAQLSKFVHPAAKMCTPVAGCTLYFVHGCVLSFPIGEKVSFCVCHNMSLIFEEGVCFDVKYLCFGKGLLICTFPFSGPTANVSSFLHD